jgi:hypothetical protein
MKPSKEFEEEDKEAEKAKEAEKEENVKEPFSIEWQAILGKRYTESNPRSTSSR